MAKLVTPLPGRAAPAPEAPPGSAHPPPAESLLPPALPTRRLPPPAAPTRPASASPYQAPPQKPAPAEALERRARLALRRGRLPVEARLDLHGMVQAQAHAALTAFLMRSRAAGHAHVLVVTGKGGTSGGTGEGGEPFAGRGVLRRSVPHWLRGQDLSGLVLGFEEAAHHHGGAGALYVRLRRR